MTDNPRHAGRPAGDGPRHAPAGGPAGGRAAPPGRVGATGEERVVIRDNRKINFAEDEPAAPVPDDPVPAEADVAEADVAEAPPEVAAAVEEAEVEAEPPAPPLGAELEALRTELDERTKDLQRVSAEFANYRKRVERDRALVVEQATAHVLAALLPVLDDLDRAREHGDLVGPFATMAEQLNTTLSKYGLSPFGAKGDRFDPTRHEAVSHTTSAEVSEPTCVEVMRRGYLLGERLLRAALVEVADPE